MGVISGILFILIGAVLVGIGQRLSEEVGTLYTAVRKHVGIVRRRWASPRRSRRVAIRPEASPQLPSGSESSLPVSGQVGQVIEQLHQGAVTESEKQQLAAALLRDDIGTLPLSASDQPQLVPGDALTASEALTLAVVASSAAKRVGERGVLAIRLTGVVIALIGVAVLLVGIFHP